MESSILTKLSMDLDNTPNLGIINSSIVTESSIKSFALLDNSSSTVTESDTL